MRIPHVTGTQINRDGDTAHQSIHKIADAIIQLYPDDDDETIMKYRLLKYRDGPSRAEVDMQWDLDRMIIQQTGHRMQYPPLGDPQIKRPYSGNGNGKGKLANLQRRSGHGRLAGLRAKGSTSTS
jgi:hypothetical protein